MAIQKAKLVTVTSVKGGAGKTTTTLNLAGVFSALKKKTLIIDLDLYTGGIATSLNVSNDTDMYKLVDDLSNNRFDFIEHYVSKYNDFIDVLPSPKDPRLASKISSRYLSIILRKAETRYDVILVDTTHLMSEMNLTMMDYSDHILYLFTNDPIAIKNMTTVVSIFKDMEKSNYSIILNASINYNQNYFSMYDIKNMIKDNIDYTIPASFYIKNIDRYLLDGEILTLNTKIQKSNKQTMENFYAIANQILK